MNFLKKIYPEKKLPKGTFKPAILGKFQFGADTRSRRAAFAPPWQWVQSPVD